MSYALLKNPEQHYYPTRNADTNVIMLHVTAGLQDLDLVGSDHSAENTNRYGATTKRAASWHSCVDSDSIAPGLPGSYTAFHCKNFNSPSLGLEISNKDARWDNKPALWTAATLKNAGQQSVEWEKEYDIPSRLLTAAECRRGLKGYSYHSMHDPKRRSDPGKSFPIEQFFAIIAQLEAGQTPDLPLFDEVVELQRILQLQQDGRWGKDTDLRARQMRTAGMQWAGFGLWTPEALPEVKLVQSVIGAKQDGKFGPKSLASLRWFIKLFQKNFDLPASGGWDRNTEAAFHVARAKYFNKF